MKIIKRIVFDSRRSIGEVGRNGIQKIDYHYATGEGDKHYCTVRFEDGTELQIFDLDEIYWRPE